MVAFSRAFVFKSMLRKERPMRWYNKKTKPVTLIKNNSLDAHAHEMGYLDDKGNLTDLGKRLWLALASDKKNNAVQ